MNKPWSADAAFGFARVANQFQNWHDECGKFVAMAHGYGGSGWNTAAEQGQAANLHQGAAPVGACHYWGGGAGHTAIEAGGGQIWSNDLAVDGEIHLSPFSDVANKWGKPYMGWAYADANTFSQSWGDNPYWSPTTPAPPPPPKPTPAPTPAPSPAPVPVAGLGSMVIVRYPQATPGWKGNFLLANAKLIHIKNSAVEAALEHLGVPVKDISAADFNQLFVGFGS